MLHHVGVALEAGHEGGLGERRLSVFGCLPRRAATSCAAYSPANTFGPVRGYPS